MEKEEMTNDKSARDTNNKLNELAEFAATNGNFEDCLAAILQGYHIGLAEGIERGKAEIAEKLLDFCRYNSVPVDTPVPTEQLNYYQGQQKIVNSLRRAIEQLCQPQKTEGGKNDC